MSVLVSVSRSDNQYACLSVLKTRIDPSLGHYKSNQQSTNNKYQREKTPENPFNFLFQDPIF
jgi:hypothetical protein